MLDRRPVNDDDEARAAAAMAVVEAGGGGGEVEFCGDSEGLAPAGRLLGFTLPRLPVMAGVLDVEAREGADGRLPFDPGLPLPVRVRMAGAPKLMRRVKGVTGAVRLLSSSSM